MSAKTGNTSWICISLLCRPLETSTSKIEQYSSKFHNHDTFSKLLCLILILFYICFDWYWKSWIYWWMLCDIFVCEWYSTSFRCIWGARCIYISPSQKSAYCNTDKIFLHVFASIPHVCTYGFLLCRFLKNLKVWPKISKISSHKIQSMAILWQQETQKQICSETLVSVTKTTREKMQEPYFAKSENAFCIERLT